MRQTTTVSQGWACLSRRFIAGRSEAVLLPEVTSEKISRLCTPLVSSASIWSWASWPPVLTRV